MQTAPIAVVTATTLANALATAYATAYATALAVALILASALSTGAAHAQADPSTAAMPRDALEAGIRQIGKACVQQWTGAHGEAKAAAFCDCVNADDIAAIRRVKTVGDMDRWLLSAQDEAKRHEAGDAQVVALFQQRLERCEATLK